MKKTLMYVAGILSGPVLVFGTLPFYDWSATGGICTMCVVSFVAVKGIWQSGNE